MDNIQITKDCVQMISNIGSTIYQNICNGKVTVVPWGSMDWFEVILLFTVIIGLGYMMKKLIES